MYLCNVCGNEFPYLIFEYNNLVCEACSIRKNITNCHELDEGIPEDFPQEEDVEDEALIDQEDTQQLFETIDQIKNPRLRAYFKIVAEQYFGHV